LNNPNWTNVAAATNASGGTVTVSTSIGQGAQEYFRVVLLPP